MQKPHKNNSLSRQKRLIFSAIGHLPTMPGTTFKKHYPKTKTILDSKLADPLTDIRISCFVQHLTRSNPSYLSSGSISNPMKVHQIIKKFTKISQFYPNFAKFVQNSPKAQANSKSVGVILPFSWALAHATSGIHKNISSRECRTARHMENYGISQKLTVPSWDLYKRAYFCWPCKFIEIDIRVIVS